MSLINSFFNESEHLFLVGGRRYKESYGINFDKVTVCSGLCSKLRALHYLYRAEKIFLHGLYESQFLYLFAIQPWLLKKCYWLIWGGDLHRYEEQRKSLKAKFKECVRARVIRRLGHIVTYIPDDYELARKWYSTKALFHECLGYESNTVTARKPAPRKTQRITIQVGNSAFPRNNHYEAIDQIASYANSNIHVIAPLSYGPKDEAKRVATYGKAQLGDKFTAIFDFLPLEIYMEQLNAVDIGVFNQIHQQAMGNMITLIGLGKTLYIRRNSSAYKLFTNLGIVVFAIDEFSLQVLSQSAQDRNINLVLDHFSKQQLINQYKLIFEA